MGLKLPEGRVLLPNSRFHKERRLGRKEERTPAFFSKSGLP